MRDNKSTHANARPGHGRAARNGMIAPVAAAIAIGVAAGVALGTAFVISGEQARPQTANLDAQQAEPAVALAADPVTAGAKTDRPVAPEPVTEVATATEPVAPPSQPELATPIGDQLPGVDTTRIALPDQATDQAPRTAPSQIEQPGAVLAQAPLAPTIVPGPAAERAQSSPTPSNPIEPGVEIARSEAEVLAIEERLSAAGAAYFQLPPDAAKPFEAALSGTALPPARTNAWVNLRAGPDNDAEVVMVVPGGAEIAAQRDCPGWCEVIYDGQRGYIYQSFIRR